MRVLTKAMELQSLAVEFDAVSGSQITVQTTTKHTGAAAIKILNPGSGALNAVHHQYSASSTTTGYFLRFYLRIHTTVGTTTAIAYFNGTQIVSAAGSPAMSLRLTTADKLQLFDSTTQRGSDSAALNHDQWYRIDLRYDGTPGSGSRILEARIDGTVFASITNSTTAYTAAWFGVGMNCGNTLLSSTGEIYIDSIGLSNTVSGSGETSYCDYCDDIVYIRANAYGDAVKHSSGTTNKFIDSADSGSTTNTGTVANINETTPDTTTYNKRDEAGGAATRGEMFTLKDAVSVYGLRTSDVIKVVQLEWYAGAGSNTSGTTRDLIPLMLSKSGGTFLQGTTVDVSTTTWVIDNQDAPRLPVITLDHGIAAGNTSKPIEVVADATNGNEDGLDTIQMGYETTSTNGSSTNGSRVSGIWLIVEVQRGLNQLPQGKGATICQNTGTLHAFGVNSLPSGKGASVCQNTGTLHTFGQHYPTPAGTIFTNGTTNATVDSTSVGVAAVGDVFFVIASSHDYVPPSWKFQSGGGTFGTEDNSTHDTPTYVHDLADFTHTGCVGNGSTYYDPSITGSEIGMRCTGTGIPSNSYVASIDLVGQLVTICDNTGAIVAAPSGSIGSVRYGGYQDGTTNKVAADLVIHHPTQRICLMIWSVKITSVSGSPTPLASITWTGTLSGSSRRWAAHMWHPSDSKTPPTRSTRVQAHGTLIDNTTGYGVPHNIPMSPSVISPSDCVAWILGCVSGTGTGPVGDFNGDGDFIDTDARGASVESTPVWTQTSAVGIHGMVGSWAATSANTPMSVAAHMTMQHQSQTPGTYQVYAGIVYLMAPTPNPMPSGKAKCVCSGKGVLKASQPFTGAKAKTVAHAGSTALGTTAKVLSTGVGSIICNAKATLGNLAFRGKGSTISSGTGTLNAGQLTTFGRIYVCYPDAYGPMTSAKEADGTETFFSFTTRTVVIDGVLFRVYEKSSDQSVPPDYTLDWT